MKKALIGSNLPDSKLYFETTKAAGSLLSKN